MSTTYNIGDVGPGGGTIFMVPITGVNEFYYEIAPVDIIQATYPQNTNISPTYTQPCSLNYTSGAEFGSKEVHLGTSYLFGEGKNNTDLICAQPSGGSTAPPNPVFDVNSIAAQMCKNWVYGGKSDWFLPSVEEMLLANGNAGNLCNWTGRGTGTYKYYTDEYWTSSERVGSQNTSKAWAVNFVNPGNAMPYPREVEKCHTRSVRAVRRFVSSIQYNYRYEVLKLTEPQVYSNAIGTVWEPHGMITDQPGAISMIRGSNNGALDNIGVFGMQELIMQINKKDTNLQLQNIQNILAMKEFLKYKS